MGQGIVLVSNKVDPGVKELVNMDARDMLSLLDESKAKSIGMSSWFSLQVGGRALKRRNDMKKKVMIYVLNWLSNRQEAKGGRYNE